jgi:hypothetical protein
MIFAEESEKLDIQFSSTRMHISVTIQADPHKQKNSSAVE